MKILVTGAAGFIGSHFIEFLLRQEQGAHEVQIVRIDNFNDYYDPSLKRENAASYADHDAVNLIEHDFCDASFMNDLFGKENFTHVMHLGAYAGVRISVDRPQVYVRNNVEGTLVMLEAVRAFPVEQFVLASSSTVYGHPAETPFREYSTLGLPASPYGATKRAAELMGMTYHQLHGTPIVCIRPFSVYGPRLRPDLALSIFTDRILKGESLPLFGDGSFRRDMTHVTDICQGLWNAMTLPGAVGERVNLGCGNPIAMSDVIQSLADAAGKPAKIDYLPEREEDLETTYADLTLARKVLNYEPKVSFAEGAKDFVNWYRGKHGL